MDCQWDKCRFRKLQRQVPDFDYSASNAGRLTRKERKQTLTEELLADRQLQAAHKRRFSKLQEEHGRFSDKKAIAKRKTSNPRLKARRKKPKH